MLLQPQDIFCYANRMAQDTHYLLSECMYQPHLLCVGHIYAKVHATYIHIYIYITHVHPSLGSSISTKIMPPYSQHDYSMSCTSYLPQNGFEHIGSRPLASDRLWQTASERFSTSVEARNLNMTLLYPESLAGKETPSQITPQPFRTFGSPLHAFGSVHKDGAFI